MTIVMHVSWEDLEKITLSGRLVLRHNANLQYGYTPEPNETLAEALKKMETYCRNHRHGNPKIVGCVKVVEHGKNTIAVPVNFSMIHTECTYAAVKINNVPLGVKLLQIMRKS